MATRSTFRFSLLFFILAAFSLSACHNYILQKVESDSYRFDSTESLAADEGVEAIIAPFRESLAEEMNEVIGYNKFEMAKQQPDNPLGTFMCDAILSEASEYYQGQIDFAVINYGGIRIPFLSAGDISVGRIFELMPFENYIVVLDLDLATTEMLFQTMTDRGGWPMSQGVEMRMDTTNLTYDVSINGENLGSKQRYKVLISDYIANGGDSCDFLKEAPRETLGVLLRDAIIDHLRGMSDTISYQLNGRISYE